MTPYACHVNFDQFECKESDVIGQSLNAGKTFDAIRVSWNGETLKLPFCSENGRELCEVKDFWRGLMEKLKSMPQPNLSEDIPAFRIGAEVLPTSHRSFQEELAVDGGARG